MFRRAAVSTDTANLHSCRSPKSSIASVRSRVLYLRGLVMVLALFPALCFPVLRAGASTKALSSVVWPTTQRGSVISVGTNPKPLKYGTVLTAAQLKQVRSLASQWSTSYSGTSGFALGYINRFQYPLITTNSGKSWSIGGPYLSGPWADASAGGTIVRALSKSVAIIYGNEWFYGTTDAGKQWFVTSFSGTAVSANEFWSKGPGAPIFTADVIVSSPNPPYPATGAAQYISSDGGKTWQLVIHPKNWRGRAVSTLKVQGSYANPAKIGTRITESDLKDFPLLSASFRGNVGYAISGAKGFQYPVKTINHGETWLVAGIWFGGPWADGASFALSIKAYSSEVAVAKTESWFYLTDDGGKHWYQTVLVGNPYSCSELRPQQGGLAPVFTCTFSSFSSPGTTATYLSDDGGRDWLLL